MTPRESQEAAGREERVELLRRQIGRRMLHQGLIRGWSAWLEAWEARSYALRQLRDVGNRLHSPELANALDFWRDEAAEAKRLATMSAQQKVRHARRRLES